MGAIDRHMAAEASWKLRRRLNRNHPTVSVWGGISINRPHRLLVRAPIPIEVPETFTWGGITYDVDFRVRGE